MKKTILLTLAAMMMALCAGAQSYTNSKYYNPSTGRLDYARHYPFATGTFAATGMYYGFRIGPAFATIASDDNDVKASDMRTGINFGVVAGTQLTMDAPLYLESGLFYSRKGGNAKAGGDNLQYSLDYITLPVLFKYDIEVEDFSVQPFLGMYGSLGVGGKMKDFKTKQVFSSFDEKFRRFDGGLRFGCGINYNPFYAEASYDFGLTNISRDELYTAHTRALMLTLGVNF